MNELTPIFQGIDNTRLVDALENIAAELEQLRVLKEHELGVRVEYASEGGGPYVPRGAGEK
jgi:hypothetical protein